MYISAEHNYNVDGDVMMAVMVKMMVACTSVLPRSAETQLQ